MLDHDIDDNIFISANKDALEQVIYNLLSRSIEALIENKGERRINIKFNNSFVSKIQGLVYTYFHPPSGTAGQRNNFV